MKIATVAWSGGLDSTAALHRVLTRDNYDHVHAHHVKLLTREGVDRAQAEMVSCSQAYYWFQGMGMQFKYTRSEYECLFDRTSGTPDIVMVAPLVTQALISEVGMMEEEGNAVTHIDLIYGDHADEFARDVFVERWDLAVQLFSAIIHTTFNGYNPRPTSSVLAPNLWYTKKEVYEYLPINLRALTTSCRKGRDCGTCNACLDLIAARGGE